MAKENRVRKFFKMNKKKKKKLHYPLRKGLNQVREPQTQEEIDKCLEDGYYYYKNYKRIEGHRLMTREEYNDEIAKYVKERDAIMPKAEQEKLRDKLAEKAMEGRGLSIDPLIDKMVATNKRIADKYRPKDKDGNFIEAPTDEELEEMYPDPEPSSSEEEE